MAERFENYDNILRDLAKDKLQKSLVEVLNRYESRKKKDKIVSCLEITQKKILELSQSAVKRD